jgi:ABC-type glycerol-3-phosphate transport system substrate-binding protein
MWYSTLLTRLTTVDNILATAENAPGTSWTAPAFVEAARLVCELRDRGFVMQGYEGSKWPSAQMQWVQGKCGLLYCGSWIPKEMKDVTPPGFRMGIFRFPVIEGQPDADGLSQDLGTEAFAIPRGARHKEAAVEFLKFITTQAETKCLVDLEIPPAVAGVGMPEALVGLDELIAPPYKLIKGLAGLTDEHAEWFRICARDSLSDVFLGKHAPEEFCRTVQGAHQRYYARQAAVGASAQK